MARILITGVTGYLGSRLAQALVGAGHAVVGFKRTSSRLEKLGSAASSIEFHDVDAEGEEAAFRVLEERIDAVIHVATSYGRSGETVSELLETNTAFPLRVLRVALVHKVPLFVNTDTTLPPFVSPYALAKRQFADWLKFHAQDTHARFINVRLEHFYGPGDDTSKFVTRLIRQCLAHVESVPLTLGEQERDFIYVDDVISAYLTFMQHAHALPPGLTEYELGTGKAVSIRRFAETVKRLTGSNTRLEFGALPYRRSELMVSRANLNALNELGWRCMVALEDGLARTIHCESQR